MRSCTKDPKDAQDPKEALKQQLRHEAQGVTDRLQKEKQQLHEDGISSALYGQPMDHYFGK